MRSPAAGKVAGGWNLARGVALVLALVLGVHFDLFLCPWARWLKFPCPGCGLTRAALLLARGDIGGAIQVHPLSPLLVPVVVAAALQVGREAVWASRLQTLRAGRPRWLVRSEGPVAWVLLVLVVGVWLARFWGAFGGPVPV